MTPDQFISRLVHDLRAPLRSLAELPDWIREDMEEADIALPVDVAESIEMIQVQAKRMALLVDGLGRYARVQRRAQIDVRPIEEVANSIALPDELTMDIGYSRFPMDADDLCFVLSELFMNAQKHNSESVCSIRLVTGLDQETAVLCVHDDGCGVSRDDAEHAFEPLRTLKTRDEIEGAGMGLSTIRKIVETYSGTVRIIHPPEQVGCSVEIRMGT